MAANIAAALLRSKTLRKVVRLSTLPSQEQAGSWFSCVVDDGSSTPTGERTVGYLDERRLLATQMFAGRSPGFLQAMKPHMRFMYFQAGNVMMTEGEQGDYVYVLLAGCVEISVGGHLVARMRDGATLGEVAALHVGASRGKRVATVRCISSCAVVAIEEADFTRVMHLFPAERGRLAAEADRRQQNITTILRWTTGKGWSPGRLRLKDVKPSARLAVQGLIPQNAKEVTKTQAKSVAIENTYQAFHHLCLGSSREGPVGQAFYTMAFNKQAADSAVTSFGLSSSSCVKMAPPEAKRREALKVDDSSLRLCPVGHADYLLKKVYQKRCDELAVKPNSGCCKALLEGDPCLCSQATIDLSNFLIGDRGFSALLPVFKHCHPGCLRSLCLAGNNLHASAVEQLVQVLTDRPSQKDAPIEHALTILDLSNNPLSSACTKPLLTLLEKRPSLLLLGLQGTTLSDMSLG
eukprot:TRINITY_DN22783_c0_g1_i2.p1 TRINITY_DN22783_c0_g1~~TRINITY_DN22783_c0_g1_i2.p1  ORF type:complete len:464 (-),score=81.34 TRINITY_DN22783_c0_g1_i2:375-1766(-)